MEGRSSARRSTPANSRLANTCSTWWCGIRGTYLSQWDITASPGHSCSVTPLSPLSPPQGEFPGADQPAAQRVSADRHPVCQLPAASWRSGGEGEAASQHRGSGLGHHAALQLQTVSHMTLWHRKWSHDLIKPVSVYLAVVTCFHSLC